MEMEGQYVCHAANASGAVVTSASVLVLSSFEESIRTEEMVRIETGDDDDWDQWSVDTL